MFGFSLSELADLSDVISATSIVGGLIFGVFQIKNMQEQQRDTIAITLSQTFLSQDLANGLTLLQYVPKGASLADIRHKGAEYEQTALTVCTSFETMGLLVFKRIAPLGLVLDLAGGTVTTTHRRLSKWLIEIREELDQPSYAEWFDWLGDQAEREKSLKLPAQIAYRDWRP